MNEKRTSKESPFDGVDFVDTISQKCEHFFEPCSLVHALTMFAHLPG